MEIGERRKGGGEMGGGDIVGWKGRKTIRKKIAA